MTEVAFGASRVSSVVALCAGAVAVALVSVGSTLSLGLGVIGWCALGVGLYRRAQLWISTSLVVVWLAVVVSVGTDVPVEVLGMSMVASVVAWDAATRAINLGSQLTTTATTYRVELLHAGMTALVGAGSFGLGYGLYAVIGGGQPSVTVLSILLSGTILLLILAWVKPSA